MKQLLAITFIGILALSQYARQLNYLECKLVNSFKPIEQRCDCEKTSNSDSFGFKEFPSPKNHVHFSLDEFYTGAKETSHTTIILAAAIKLYDPANESILYGINEQPDRPPSFM